MQACQAFPDCSRPQTLSVFAWCTKRTQINTLLCRKLLEFPVWSKLIWIQPTFFQCRALLQKYSSPVDIITAILCFKFKYEGVCESDFSPGCFSKFRLILYKLYEFHVSQMPNCLPLFIKKQNKKKTYSKMQLVAHILTILLFLKMTKMQFLQIFTHTCVFFDNFDYPRTTDQYITFTAKAKIK